MADMKNNNAILQIVSWGFSLDPKAANAHVEHDNGARMEVFPRRPHRRSLFLRQAAELAKNNSRQETAQRLEFVCFGLVGGGS